MLIYRPHRGMLKDAMLESKEFISIDAMKRHIVDDWSTILMNPFTVDDVVICGDPMDDERIGWKDTRYVCVRRLGDEDYLKKYGAPQCIGMCATKYPGSR